MTTAFVLPGGANLGAVQVGMLRAVHEADIHADVLLGASVGAINAAWVAGPIRATAWPNWLRSGHRCVVATCSR